MSILVQNIQDKAHLFYLLGNPFLTQLVSYDFNFGQDEELTDYFVNFLKALVLRLDSETINFFFNERMKTFPLFQAALKLYNSSEQLVRTSVRSITLSIYELGCPAMHQFLARLPFSAFYANLACHLRDLWICIETHVEQVTPTDEAKHMQVVMKQVEDVNETLYYIEDLLEVTSR